MNYDILIIGAGASGLMAAWDLSIAGKRVAILEAKDRIGGRIFDIHDDRFSIPVELGAEFVHGDLELTNFILKKANAKPYERSGDVFKFEGGEIQESDFIEDYSLLSEKFKQLKYDISVQQFFDQYLYEEKHQQLRASLQKYVEGYYAAELTDVSTFALRDEMENSSDAQYGIEGGYTLLLNYLHTQLKQNGCDIILSAPAEKIEWKENQVTAHTKYGIYSAQKILITVSMGVLQFGTLTFIPVIDDKINAAKHLGFGHVIKIVLQFEKAFWKEKDELQNMNFLFSEETIPTWWTTYPKESNTLVGWLGGPNAKAFKDASEEEVVDKAIDSLSNIFSIDVVHLKQMLIASHAFNWSNDPFTLGAYSFDVVNGYKYKQIIRDPIANTVFFAGEGLHDGPEIGTVEAALQTGRKAAQLILKNT